MKEFITYLAICVVLIATGCTDFGTETQLTLPDGPDIEILNIVAESDSITFNVKPAGTTGFYSWMVVESNEVNASIQADRVLKLTAGGLANGVANYDNTKDLITGVGNLKPFTVYQIYVVAANVDGVVGKVKNASIRTLDDGGKPTPKSFGIADSTVTLTFSEPLQLGTGKVYVSYFAKNTLSGSKPLVVAPGYESYNPQDIEVEGENLSINGSALVIKLPAPPIGAYASITYDSGAVLDLEGNAANAYTNKADTIVSGAPSRGITVRLATKTWALYSEFAETVPDTIAAFSKWDELIIPALADEGISVRKKITTKTPLVTYKQSTRTTTVDVSTWGLLQGVPSFFLPEEPAFGAIVDLSIPKGSFEDVYGNENDALVITDNYLYSYGYTDADIIGTYDIAFESYYDGPLSETGITIEKDTKSSSFLIKNLFEAGTVIKAEFDPVMGILSIEDYQLFTEGFLGKYEIYFANADNESPVLFKVPAVGKITSDENTMWGYYADGAGWWDVFTSSVWTRTSMNVSSTASMNSGRSDKSARIPRTAPFSRK